MGDTIPPGRLWRLGLDASGRRLLVCPATYFSFPRHACLHSGHFSASLSIPAVQAVKTMKRCQSKTANPLVDVLITYLVFILIRHLMGPHLQIWHCLLSNGYYQSREIIDWWTATPHAYCVCVCSGIANLSGQFSWKVPNQRGHFELRGLFRGPRKSYL